MGFVEHWTICAMCTINLNGVVILVLAAEIYLSSWQVWQLLMTFSGTSRNVVRLFFTVKTPDFWAYISDGKNLRSIRSEPDLFSRGNQEEKYFSDSTVKITRFWLYEDEGDNSRGISVPVLQTVTYIHTGNILPEVTAPDTQTRMKCRPPVPGSQST